MSDTHDKLLDHEYDGIRELDNDLPRWWVWLFYLCIAWGVLYFLYYHTFGIGYSSADQYRLEIDPNYQRVAASGDRALGILPEYRSPLYSAVRDAAFGADKKPVRAAYKEERRETDTATYVALTEPADLEAGKAIFIKSCASCHGNLGEGKIGPNLTDDYWIHGAGMTNVVMTIKYGFPTKGMLAWRGELKPQQILQVGSYILALHGTNPPNPKAPQGELVTQ